MIAPVLAALLVLSAQEVPTPVPAPAAAAPEAAGGETAVQAKALLDRLAARHRGAATMRASFVQERRSALLAEPLASRGTFLWRREPGTVVFEVALPRPARIRMDATSYQVHRPQDGEAERFEFESNELGKMLLSSFTPDPGQLEKAFQVESLERQDGAARITLVPTGAAVREFMTSFRVVIRETDAVLEEIGYRDAEGDDVKISIRDLELDPPLDSAAFDAALPPGTRLLVHRVKEPERR